MTSYWLGRMKELVDNHHVAKITNIPGNHCCEKKIKMHHLVEHYCEVIPYDRERVEGGRVKYILDGNNWIRLSAAINNYGLSPKRCSKLHAKGVRDLRKYITNAKKR